jgi:hypothetical protein
LAQYSAKIKTAATNLETLCRDGHNAETRTIRDIAENTDSSQLLKFPTQSVKADHVVALKEFEDDVQASLSSNARDLQNLRRYVEKLESNQKGIPSLSPHGVEGY